MIGHRSRFRENDDLPLARSNYGRFARCPVRPESFCPDRESFRPEYEVVSPGLRVDSPDEYFSERECLSRHFRFAMIDHHNLSRQTWL